VDSLGSEFEILRPDVFFQLLSDSQGTSGSNNKSADNIAQTACAAKRRQFEQHIVLLGFSCNSRNSKDSLTIAPQNRK
jgi:hypothetical protein